MPKIPTQSLRDTSAGIIQKVDEGIVPPNSVYMAMNLLFDETLGRGVVRGGTTQLGSQIVDGASCLGLYQHITSAGTKVPLAVFNASGDATSVLSKYTSSSWSNAKTGLTASAKARFTTFLDTTAMINGTDTISSADGSSWVTTGGNLDVGNMPAGLVIEEFLDKVYIAGVSGNLDRLSYSSTPTAGAVSWTSGNGNIDVEPEEGAGAISGLSKVPGYLLVFKERSMKRWDTYSTYPESLVTIGAPSQEAIVRTKQSCFYYNRRGIYETTGGYPRKISRPIQAIIEAIPSSYYPRVAGHGDGERVFFSIGDITIGDLSLTNCVIVYTIDSQHCTLLSFPNEYKRWANFVDSNGDEIILAGDDDGNVWKVLDGTTGDGANDDPIEFLLQYNAQEFGSRGRRDSISKIVVYSKDVRNGALHCKINGEGSFKQVGKINENIKEVITELRGNYFEFRIQGRSQSAEIIGIDFPENFVDLSFKS